MSFENLLSAFVAALVGLFTAVGIEAIKTMIFEQDLRDEEREYQKVQDLLQFYSTKDEQGMLPPVARLLISSPSQQVPMVDIDEEKSKMVNSYRDILEDVEDPTEWEKALKPRKFLFWTYPPKGYVHVIRTHYKPDDAQEFADVWETKKDVMWLGRILTIGRKEGNNLCLDQGDERRNLISRQHAVIRYENGNYILYNLVIAKNQILVNDSEIGFSHVLKNDDVIKMLPYYIQFEQRAVDKQDENQ